MNTPFLANVAKSFTGIDPAELSGHCFVFPNKRSATFFRHYLRRTIAPGVSYIEPEFIDIAAFVARFSDLAEASRYESLFTLYKCYSSINKAASDEPLSFDRFLFWGEMLISDFNDVDRYLVDPKSLFTNLKHLKEIGSTYLSPEQIDIIKRYWGAEAHQLTSDTETFWTHIDNENSISGPRFKQLWEVLAPLYLDFMASLQEKGLTTNGRLYRMAAEHPEPAGMIGAAHVSFVGFNVLTTAELKLFRRLKAAGVASFFWDFNSPFLRAATNKAGRFISKNIEEFPPPPQYCEPAIDSYPQIDIIGVPSNIGQTKMAGDVIDRWHSEGIIDTSPGSINTAVVLPDESLLIPMIHSMPGSIVDMNVTMGFPMRYSPVSAIIGSIVALQRHARRKEGGTVASYFHEDVRHLLSMPMIQGIDPEAAASLEAEIKARRLYNVDYDTIASTAPEIAPVFRPVSAKSTTAECHAYIKSILDFLGEAVDEQDILQHCLLRSYSSAVDTLVASMEEYDVTMDAFTFLNLVGRAVRRDSVTFTGEPLRGLQVMGMLETRALDFDNIVVLSMNEHVFPRKQHSQSFIPDVLRRAFGMATTDFQESIFAYYFYRLISRASRVTIIYDSRSVGGVKSSEMSRYITQLLYLFPQAGARLLSARLPRPDITDGATVIHKTQPVRARLEKFTEEGSGWNLSASAINTYIDCPLKFYLQYVERYNPDEEITDYVDYSTYGSIVHQVMERIYKCAMTDGRPATITPEFIDSITGNANPLLSNIIREAINNNFNKIKEPALYRDLVGETAVLGRIIRTNIVDLLKLERKLWTPFTIIGAEKDIRYRLYINPGLTVNIKQIIDRVDAVSDPDSPDGQRLRIIDYKTGSDPLASADIQKMFRAADMRPKAIAQLLFYCHVYSLHEGIDRPIQPLIIKMRNIYSGITPLKIGREPVTDYRDHIDEFVEQFNRVVEEIFDPEVPFTPAATDHPCTFCNFKAICSRQ